MQAHQCRMTGYPIRHGKGSCWIGMNDGPGAGGGRNVSNRPRWVDPDGHDNRLHIRHNRLDGAIPGGPLMRG